MVSTATSTTCSQRIGAELKQREADIQRVLDSEYEEDIALSVDSERITKVAFSWRVPNDSLEIYWTPSYGAHKVIYRFSDWFDTATREIDFESPLWKYADDVVKRLQEANF